MTTRVIALQAGVALQLDYSGDYFHLLETTGPVDVELLKAGRSRSKAGAVEYGYWIKPTDGFNGIILTSATTQSIKVNIDEGMGGYDRTTGSVSLLGTRGEVAHTQSSVTNANATIKAANAARNLLEVQNNSMSAVMRLRVDGTNASTTSGIRVQPGEIWSPKGYMPTGAINACMETADATANNVEVVEG